jgi:hypothetical protein
VGRVDWSDNEWFCGGMKQLSILITVFLCTIGNLTSKVNPQLKVKSNYKTVDLVVENVSANKLGITSESIQNIIKLRFLANGIKVRSGSRNPIYVKILVSDTTGMDNSYRGTTAIALYICLVKFSSDYDLDGKYFGKLTDTGSMLFLGQVNSSTFKTDIEKCTDAFLLDYLESNME